MEFFIDTSDVETIKEINKWFPISGVTTNPILVAQSGKKHETLIEEIINTIDVPVSAEVLSTSAEGMIKEIEMFSAISPKVIMKIPLIKEGLKATRILRENTKTKKLGVNVTLCFSVLQALTAAKAGATFVSVFVGRLDDTGVDGMGVVAQIMKIFSQYQIKTKIIVASVRSLLHVEKAAAMGADIITLPPKLFSPIVKHTLTDTGLEQFLKAAGTLK